MDTLRFKAIGTEWGVSLDDVKLPNVIAETIRTRVGEFERRFSRFLPDSEVNSFKDAEAGTYTISDEFAKLLTRAMRLRELTNGVYDPAVAGLLERTGYDATYSFTERDVDAFRLAPWSLDGNALLIKGPLGFDLGGIGKGYCIDLVATLLSEHGYEYFMVEAGGDMYGTTKADGRPWKVAIEYPGRPDEALGTTILSHTAIAVSDTLRRRWGAWHHLIDPHTKQTIERIVSAVAVAPTAWDADCMTSVLFLGKEENYAEIAAEFKASYIVMNAEGSCLKSNNWQGEVFT